MNIANVELGAGEITFGGLKNIFVVRGLIWRIKYKNINIQYIYTLVTLYFTHSWGTSVHKDLEFFFIDSYSTSFITYQILSN